MYNYKSTIKYDDIAGKSAVKSSEKDKQTLLATLGDIDSRYSQKQQTGLGLTPLSYDNVKSDSEVAKQAESMLGASYIADTQKIGDSYNQQSESQLAKKKSADEQFKTLADSLEEQYGKRKTAAENDALRRGLARSSVIVKSIEEFDKQKISGVLELEQNMLNLVGEADRRIEELEQERENALKNYELTHAAQVQAKIYELTQQRDKQMEDIIKYNNTIQEKEVKHMASTTSAQDEKLNTYLMQEEKVSALKEYYNGMDKNAAIADLTSDSALKEHLGSYYNYMLNYLINKN